MDKYYYMVAQLPALFFDKEAAIDIPTFLEEAQKWLTKRDYQRLSKINLYETAQNGKRLKLWQQYILFELQFRTELAGWRQAHIEGQEYKPSHFALSMVKEGNPLEIEKKLLHHRWQWIDSQEQGHHFDLDFLILYYLKLQILQKLSVFNKEKGLEKFREIEAIRLVEQEEVDEVPEGGKAG